MRRASLAATVALAVAIAGCGTRGDLIPPPGQTLPSAPYGRLDRPTAEELLTRPVQAAPERSVELRRRSEEREDDPFDLPPEEMGTVQRRSDPAAEPKKPAGDCPPLAGQGSSPRLADCRNAAPMAAAAG